MTDPRPGVFLTAEWRYLAMFNYEVEPALLEPLVPSGTQLDSWRGRTHVSVVGFLFLHTRVLGLRIPFHTSFEEVNLRFYVRRKAGSQWRRGVVFVRELVPRWAIAFVAALYGERFVGTLDTRPSSAFLADGSAVTVQRGVPVFP